MIRKKLMKIRFQINQKRIVTIYLKKKGNYTLIKYICKKRQDKCDFMYT